MIVIEGGAISILIKEIKDKYESHGLTITFTNKLEDNIILEDKKK